MPGIDIPIFASIRSTRNGAAPIAGGSRDDLQVGDAIGLYSVELAATYSWTFLYKPDGSVATFSGSASDRDPGSFTVDLPGSYLINLVINAGTAYESSQAVRLRRLTALGQKLTAAGEYKRDTVAVPVDANQYGWTDDLNANLLLLEDSITSGAQGPQGSPGAQGDQGAQGAAGSPGAQGDQGAAGSPGAQGDQGAAGSPGAQGDQGAQGAPGAQGDQGAQGAQGGGLLAAGPWDWADPYYEVAGDQLTTINAGSWADAGGAFGGLTTIQVTAVDSRLLLADNGFDSSGSPLSTDRVNGILTPVSAGDFTRFMRVGFRRSVTFGVSSFSTLKATMVFVDGVDSSQPWYSGGVSWSAGDGQVEVFTLWSPSSGANRWETYVSFQSHGLIYGGITTFDLALQRTGTNLIAYLAPARGRMLKLGSWTVSTGAGRIGLRFQTQSGTTESLSGLLMAYRESLTVVP